MTDATWEFAVDLNGDGDFGDVSEDLTPDVLVAEWALGFDGPQQPIAPPARATIILRNADGKYSPEHASALSGFDVGVALRIRSTFSSTTRQHIMLWVKRIEPLAGQFGPRRTKVVAEGFMARAQRYQTDAPMQLNKRGDQLVTALLEATRLYPPGATGRWFVAVVGQGELGQSTKLGTVTDYTNLDAGSSVFPFAFDNSARQSSLYAQLRVVAESEQGRVFVDRDGKIVFWSRHHLPKITASAETFADSMFDMTYSYGKRVANRVTVRHNPRELLTSGTPTLFTLQTSVRIEANGSREVLWRYSEADSDTRISTTDGITPVAITDYTANSASDGSGSDVTGNVSVTAEFLAQSVRLIWTNSSGQDAYLQPGSKVRGNNKLRDLGRMEVSHEDATSIAAYGRQAVSVNARLLEDAVTADSLARWIVNSRKQPHGEVTRVKFRPRRSAALMTAALARVIGERISISEKQTGSSSDHYIIGERHRLRDGGALYDVQWTLEPAAAQDFWILNTVSFGELNQKTTLGY